MNKNIALALMGVVIALLLVSSYCVYRNQRNELKELSSYYSQDTIKFRNKNNELNVRLEQTTVDLKTAKLLFKRNIDSLSKELKVKPKSIKSDERVSVETIRTEIEVPYAVHDTFNIKGKNTFTYSDKWMRLVGSSDSNGLMIDTLKTFNRIHIYQFWKREKWYSLHKKLYIQAKDENVYANNIGLEQYEISDRKRRFTTCFGAGYGYNGQKFQPFVGFMIGYKLIEF